jgi:histidyl-tRNA synthetase
VPPDELVPDGATDRLLGLLTSEGGGRSRLDDLASRLDGADARAGLSELETVFSALDGLGLPAERYTFDPAMVRGLEYYTGTIFETVVTDPPIGSLTGGGRFDGLVALFGRDMPAVGTSFGVDRLEDVLLEHGLFPPFVEEPTTRVLVALFDANRPEAALRTAAALRAGGVSAEMYLEADSIGDQIRHALRRGIPLVAIVGPDEELAGTVTLRHLDANVQHAVPLAGVALEASRLLEGA